MGGAIYRDEHHEHPEAPEALIGPIEAARRRRIAALKAAEGLWKDRTDVPKDGVQAQGELRAEWR